MKTKNRLNDPAAYSVEANVPFVAEELRNMYMQCDMISEVDIFVVNAAFIYQYLERGQWRVTFVTMISFRKCEIYISLYLVLFLLLLLLLLCFFFVNAVEAGWAQKKKRVIFLKE